MALIAKESSGKEIPPAPEGTHVARCIMLVDMGTQENVMFKKWAPKCRITFELPEEKFVFDEQRGPEPYVVGNDYTLSTADRSNLRKMLKSWRGRDFTAEEVKEFQLKNILDKPCLLTIGHRHKDDGRVFAEILSIGPLMKSMVAPPRILPLVYYEIEQGKDDTYKTLPEWIRDRVNKCQEWQPKDVSQNKIDSADVPMPHTQRDDTAAEAAMALAPVGAGETETPF